MDFRKINFIYELIFTISIIPVMIGAILNSINLLGAQYPKSIFVSMFMQNNGGVIIDLILMINMIIALASIQLLFINLALITKKTPNMINFGSWANFMIKLCALSNIIVIWFIEKTQQTTTTLIPALTLWTTTLIISIIFSILLKITKNNYSQNP